MGEDDAATTTADIPSVPMPFTMVRGRKRKRARVMKAGPGGTIHEAWKTRKVDDDTWEVKQGKKWVRGKWRTVGNQRVFLKGGGGTLPAKPNAMQAKKPGLVARIKAALSSAKAGWKSAAPGRRREDIEMHGIGEVARRLQESDGMKAASRNVVELLAVDMAEAPKVARRLEKVLGDKAAEAGPALAEALMPVITKWLEAQGIKVQGSAAAEKALKQAAR